MKKFAFAALLALSAIGTSCAWGIKWGDGNVVASSRTVAGFQGIEVSGAATLELSQGSDYSCVVNLDKNLQGDFAAEVRGGWLHLGFKPGTSVWKVSKLNIAVTLPSLAGLKASGASSVRLGPGFSGKELMIDLSGASNLRGEAAYPVLGLKASGASRISLGGAMGQLAAELSGASTLDLKASCEGLTGNLSGASRINAADVALKGLELHLSGGSTAIVGVISGKATVEASGASSFSYSGSPELDQSLSGASSIHHR